MQGPKLSSRPPQPLQVAINGTDPLIPFPNAVPTPLPSGLAPEENAEDLFKQHRQNNMQHVIAYPAGASPAGEAAVAGAEGTAGAIAAAVAGDGQAEMQYAAERFGWKSQK